MYYILLGNAARAVVVSFFLFCAVPISILKLCEARNAVERTYNFTIMAIVAVLLIATFRLSIHTRAECGLGRARREHIPHRLAQKHITNAVGVTPVLASFLFLILVDVIDVVAFSIFSFLPRSLPLSHSG